MKRYVAIVNQLPVGYQEGVYSRLKESNFIHSFTSKKGVETALTVAKLAVAPVLAVPGLLKDKIKSPVVEKATEIEMALTDSATKLLFDEEYHSLIRTEESLYDWKHGGIALTCARLKGNFQLEPKPFFSCLYDAIPGLTEEKFKTLMLSGGGSELIMIEKKKVPIQLHVEGERVFSIGLYIVHPKKEDKLISLDRYSEDIASLTLNEVLNILGYLGAKKVSVYEAKGKDVSSAFGAETKIAGGSATVNYSKGTTHLRSKEFQKSSLDIGKAKAAMFFTSDFPNFRSLIETRINHDVTKEVIQETIDANLGLDASINKLMNKYTASVSVAEKTFWRMEVEFYSKVEYNKNWLKKIF